MANEFETPLLLSPARIPDEERFILRQVMTRGWHRARAHPGPLMTVTLLTGFAVLFTLPSIIGVLIVAPMLLWGYATFLLECLDGEARVTALFSGFSDFRRIYGRCFGFLLVIFLLGLPSNMVRQLASSFELPVIGFVASFALQVLLTFMVVVRLYLAPFFMVDQSLGFKDALIASWNATGRQRLMTAGLALVTGLIAVSGFLLVGVGGLFTVPLGYLMWAAAYRQMYARRAGGARSSSTAY